MNKLPRFVDMARSPEENKGAGLCTPCEPTYPVYPWGLSIRLGNDELEKLDLEADCEAGDLIHLFCLAKVTAVSQNEVEQDGKRVVNKSVEMQITHIALESEDQENQQMKRGVRSPYK